jgi:hypothetical protein
MGGGWPPLRPVWEWLRLGHGDGLAMAEPPPWPKGVAGMGWFSHPCYLILLLLLLFFFFFFFLIIDLIFKIKLKINILMCKKRCVSKMVTKVNKI